MYFDFEQESVFFDDITRLSVEFVDNSTLWRWDIKSGFVRLPGTYPLIFFDVFSDRDKPFIEYEIVDVREE